MSRSWLARWSREPLLHFFLAAAVLLVAQALYRGAQKPTVTLDTGRLEEAAASLEEQRRASAEPLDRVALARSMLEEELLYREALRRGLVEHPAVRASLVAQMRELLDPVLPDPTDAQLQALRDEYPSLYRFPPRAGFEHVSYLEASSVPEGLLEQLREGADPSRFGERIRLAHRVHPTYRPQLVRILGEETTARLFSEPLGTWFGPVTSERGVHFIRVIEREAESAIPWDRLRPTLETNWLERERRRYLSAQLSEIAQGYQFDLPAAYEAARP